MGKNGHNDCCLLWTFGVMVLERQFIMVSFCSVKDTATAYMAYYRGIVYIGRAILSEWATSFVS